MKLFLHFMVDDRFKEIVHEELRQVGLSFDRHELEMDDLPILPEVKYGILKRSLERFDHERSYTKQTILVAKLKQLIAETVKQNADGPPYIKYSLFLSEKMGHSYAYLSSMFSRAQCCTLERYIIAQRIEMVKVLLVKEDLGLSEIAWRLGYCSIAHLSNQFKKITGTTPTAFKNMARAGEHPHGVLCEPCRQSWMNVLEEAEVASPAVHHAAEHLDSGAMAQRSSRSERAQPLIVPDEQLREVVHVHSRR